MKLPITEIPSSTVNLPVLKKDVRVRAMTIKEEKNILTAKDAGDTDDILYSISELVKACTYDSLDFETLPMPDIIAIFIKIIKLSKGTVCTHNYICHNMVEDKDGNPQECLCKFSSDVDLDNIVFRGGSESDTIHLNNGIVISMKYPTPEIYEKARQKATKDNELDETDFHLRVYAYCISNVIQGSDIYTEFTDDEIYEWFLSLNEKELEKFVPFFENVPVAELKYTVTCPKCQHTETITLRGLDDFFTQDILESRL